MRLLLDTHVLLWALIEPTRLSKATQAVLEDPENEVLFSAASIWEIAIKSALGRADFQVAPAEILEAAQTGIAGPISRCAKGRDASTSASRSI